MRAAAVWCALALVAGVLAPPAVPAAGAPAEVFSHRECSSGDFGRGLIATSALGSPRRAVAGVPQAGVVEVHPENWGADEPPLVLTSASVGVGTEPMGRFGAAVLGAQVSFPDYCADLVIGMPGADGGRGAVVVVPDLGSGFDVTRAVRLPTATLGLRPGDALGSALGVVQSATGALIVAGAPGRDLPHARNAGELVSWLVPAAGGTPAGYPETPSVPTAQQPLTYVQGAGGILGHGERADRFGSVIATDPVDGRYGPATLIVGIPKEDIGRTTNAGAVALLTFTNGVLTGNDLLWQGHGLPGKSRKGDQLGAAVASRWGSGRAYGIPGKDADGRRNSGAVIVWQPAAATGDDPGHAFYRVITQNTRGVPDKSEKGDRFGAALAIGAGMAWPETHTVAVGVPGEDLRRRTNAGAVTWLNWMAEDDPPHFAFSALTASGLAKGDALGSRLVVVSDHSDMEEDTRDTLYAGAPGEDRPGARNAGRYYVTAYPKYVPTAVRYADGRTANERFGE